MRPDRREPRDVRWIRRGFQHWPFRRGKGLLLRLVRGWLGRRRFVFEIEPGIVLRPDFDDRILCWAFVDGQAGWDPIMGLSRALIRPGDVVVDVGANVGLWLLGAARRAGRAGSVHAFEPVPANIARLRDHLALNALEFVRCDARALSSAPGAVTFFRSTTGNSGTGSLAHQEGVEARLPVIATTLDLYCAERGIGCVHFLKVDVEGAELSVFRGGARLLGADLAPAIMFEADDALAAAFSSSTAAAKSFLEDAGYQIFDVTGTRLVPVARSATHVNHDLLALKPYHVDRHPFLREYLANT